MAKYLSVGGEGSSAAAASTNVIDVAQICTGVQNASATKCGPLGLRRIPPSNGKGPNVGGGGVPCIPHNDSHVALIFLR